MAALFGIVLVLCLTSAVLSAPVNQYEHHSENAMQSTCNGLMPGEKLHGHYPQTTIAPYTIKVSRASINPGDTIVLTMNGNQLLDDFKGVLVQARTQTNISPIGKFSSDASGTTLIDCEPGKENSYLFISSEPVNVASVSWTAPSEWNGDEIHFEIVFVKDLTTFWSGIKSAPINIAVT